MEGRNANGTFKKGHSGNADTRFKKGDVGNPKGVNGTASDLLKELAEEADPRGSGKTKKELILQKVLDLATAGDLRATEIYLNRVEGKAREFIEQKIVRDELIIE